MMLPTTGTTTLHGHKRNGHFSIKSAYNFILSLLILHWCYMICQMIFGETFGEEPFLYSPKEQQELQPHEPHPFEFHWDWHPRNRSDRFPSVEQRVKLYMSNWYLPPCLKEDLLEHRVELVDNKWPRAFVSSHNDTLELDSVVDADVKFVLHDKAIQDCARTIPQIEQEGPLETEERVKKRINLQSYCSQVVGLVEYMHGLDFFTLDFDATQQTPIICQFGDNDSSFKEKPIIPVISKWRAAATRENLQQVISPPNSCSPLERPILNTTVKMYEGISPIVWKLEMCRHWDPLEFARQQDFHWEEKKLGALWRGDLTGKHLSVDQMTDEQVCFANQRCRFVFQHRNSQLVNAGLSDGLNWLKSGNISGVPVIKERVSMQQIQQYKVIISFEGNDVASGLKWSLLSESVVLMPKPTKTSWAMEELLEEWVHYIPLKSDGSNAEEMITWVGDHDEEARRIAERGRLFMYDLLYHPDAARDERDVKAEIARRYRALWQ
jgi:hypothetical protein